MRRAVLSLLAVLLSQAAYPAARLTYMVGGKPVPIAWAPSAFPLTYEINRRAAASMFGGATSVTRAFDAWAAIPESAIAFRDAGITTVDAGKDGHNTISLSDDLYSTSGFIAYTTTWFDDAGQIQEADIQVDASSASDPNVSGVVEHEIGHLLGLDHSAVLTSIMYPYVRGNSPLDSDDVLAAGGLYPGLTRGSEKGTLRGSVYGTDGAVFAAQIVAVDAGGAATASTLTDASGNFALNVPPGDYRIYAEPLDGPVDVQNLSGVWRDAANIDFRTQFYPRSGSIHLEAGQSVDGISIRGDGKATLNPQYIGTFAVGSRDVTLTSMATNVRPGETISIGIGGEGTIPGVTQFEILSKDLTRVSEFDYGTNYVWATYKVSSTATPGSLVVVVSNGSEEAALTGALRVIASPARSRAVR